MHGPVAVELHEAEVLFVRVGQSLDEFAAEREQMLDVSFAGMASPARRARHAAYFKAVEVG